MHDALLQAQQQWDSCRITKFLAQVAGKVGADIAQPVRWRLIVRWVQQTVAAGQALGFNGTPTFQFVLQQTGKTYSFSGESVDVFARWIDTLLAGKEPRQNRPRGGVAILGKAEGPHPIPATVHCRR
jgi:hypothetical protein